MLRMLGIVASAVALCLAGAALAIAGTGTGASGHSVEGQAFTAPVATYQSSLTGNQRFVYQAYKDILGRTPTSPDIVFWTTALGSGATRSDVAAALLGSSEYRTALVGSIYQSYLHRDPSPFDLSFYLGLLGSGATDEQVKASVLGSAEFFLTQGGGTVDGFLNALYEDVLGRSIDPTALAIYEAQISGGATDEAVALDVLTSTEGRQVLVRGYYQRFLHRVADDIGLNAYVAMLAGGGTDEDVIAAIVGGSEYLANVSRSTATIDWGDSSPASTVTFTVSGTDTLSSSHTYSEEGTYPVGVTISDIDGTFTISGSNTDSDAALSASPESFTVPKKSPFTHRVATFTDANPGAPASDFTATINWGDGEGSTGTVSAVPGGGFAVAGRHEYKKKGTYSVRVQIADDGGSSANAASTVEVIGQNG
jgi:hypothetical protein